MPNPSRSRAKTQDPLLAARSAVAHAGKRHNRDDPEFVAAQQNLKTEKLARSVREAVDQAPPITPVQRARIIAILKAAGDE